jgi:hypothetical protein
VTDQEDVSSEEKETFVLQTNEFKRKASERKFQQIKWYLGEGIMNPVLSDIGGTIMKDHVGLPCLQVFSEEKMKQREENIRRGLLRRTKRGRTHRIALRQESVVISSWMVMQFRIGLMGTRSTPMMTEETGIYLLQTCEVMTNTERRGKIRGGKRVMVLRDLKPAARSSAQIKRNSGRAKEVIFLIQLY